MGLLVVVPFKIGNMFLDKQATNQLQRWFEDDDALERALSGEWFLLPLGSDASGPICLKRKEGEPCLIGRVNHEDSPGMSATLSSPQISERHAHISYRDGAFYVTDLGSEHGTWLTDNEGRRHRVPPNFPTRFHPSYMIEFGTDKKAMYRVKVMTSTPKVEENNQNAAVLQTA